MLRKSSAEISGDKALASSIRERKFGVTVRSSVLVKKRAPIFHLKSAVNVSAVWCGQLMLPVYKFSWESKYLSAQNSTNSRGEAGSGVFIFLLPLHRPSP